MLIVFTCLSWITKMRIDILIIQSWGIIPYHIRKMWNGKRKRLLCKNSYTPSVYIHKIVAKIHKWWILSFFMSLSTGIIMLKMYNILVNMDFYGMSIVILRCFAKEADTPNPSNFMSFKLYNIRLFSMPKYKMYLFFKTSAQQKKRDTFNSAFSLPLRKKNFMKSIRCKDSF